MSLKIFTFEFFSNFTLDLFQVTPFATTQKDEGGGGGPNFEVIDCERS